MTFPRALLLLLATTACATTPPRAPLASNRSDLPVAEVRRASTYLDADRQRLGLGTISIAVRAVDTPTNGLDAVFVELRSTSDSLLSRKAAEKNGLVVFDSVRAGTYAMVASRMGLARMRFPAVVVDAGCRVDIEAYLRIADVDYYPVNPPRPPRTPGRATITYCRAP